VGRSFGSFLGAVDDSMATFSAPMDVLFRIIVGIQYSPSLHQVSWKEYMSIDTDDDKRPRMFGHPLDAPESHS